MILPDLTMNGLLLMSLFYHNIRMLRKGLHFQHKTQILFSLNQLCLLQILTLCSHLHLKIKTSIACLRGSSSSLSQSLHRFRNHQHPCLLFKHPLQSRQPLVLSHLSHQDQLALCINLLNLMSKMLNTVHSPQLMLSLPHFQIFSKIQWHKKSLS